MLGDTSEGGCSRAASPTYSCVLLFIVETIALLNQLVGCSDRLLGARGFGIGQDFGHGRVAFLPGHAAIIAERQQLKPALAQLRHGYPTHHMNIHLAAAALLGVGRASIDELIDCFPKPCWRRLAEAPACSHSLGDGGRVAGHPSALVVEHPPPE